MIVIVEREPGSNRWEYPDDTSAFKRSVTVGKRLFVHYMGLLDLAALTANVSYTVVEHTGLMPTQAFERHVGMNELGERLPDAVMVELKDFELDKAAAPNVRRASSAVITRIYSNYSVDVFDSDFKRMLDGIAANTSLTQAEADDILDQLKYG